MSNNCLVTKLKVSVDNDNLPVLNVLSFDCPVIQRNDPQIYIMTGTKQVVLYSEIDLYQTYNFSDTPVRELTIASGVNKTIYVKKADAQTAVSDCFSIKGEGIYELQKLGSNFVNFQPSVKNNLNSQEYNEALRAFGSPFTGLSDIKLPVGLQFLHLNSFDSKYAEAPYSLRVFMTANAASLDAKTRANTSILRMVDVVGDIINIPKNILTFNASKGASVYGNIEQMVNRLITDGRTTGSIKISLVTPACGITCYNGQQEAQSLYSIIGVEKTLSWDSAGNISWSDANPEGVPANNIPGYFIV